MSDPVTYTAVLPVAEETVLFVSRLLPSSAAAAAPAVGAGRWAATGTRCWSCGGL